MKLKTIRRVFVLLLTLTLISGTVYALTSVSFFQTLGVPTGSLALYTTDKEMTPIADASDQTAIWDWYNATNSFNASIYVYNNGASTIDFAVSVTGLATGWTFSYNAIGGTSNLLVEELRLINLSVTNPSATSEDSTGTFTITVVVI